MREKVVAIKIACKDDMTRLEEELCRVMGGKGKSVLFRSKDFISLRLCALYGKGKAPMSVYFHNIQVQLAEDKMVKVFLLTTELQGSEPPVVLGKRTDHDLSDVED